ncbi:glycosyltransferase [Alicyclobacillus fodiniaquatilis]|uniref:Glycosyltransferase n=1 Tax=Alicyclobacillus fodiniaquatilis TaxID=1661150 RepID=A0ABW4JLZ1_9BACL
MKNKVSIVIPFYNCRFINEAIESALEQTYKNIEVVIVDDGSTMHLDKVRPYVHLSKVRYVYKPNGGTATALNRGIAVSKGEYFVWLSADDVIVRDKVEKQLNFMLERNAYFSYTAYFHINEHTQIVGEPIIQRFQTKISFVRTMLSGCPINGSSVMIRMNVFSSIGCFDELLLYTHDYDLWLRMLPHYELYYLDEPLTLYRLHDGMGTKTHQLEIPPEITYVQQRRKAAIEALIERGEIV